MLSALEIALMAAAFVAGLTGAWSPCGFSMVETVGPTGHDRGRPTTLIACVMFAIGALVGGVATFGGLALLGSALHTGGGLMLAAAAVVAVMAALGELRAVRIVPQIRRQVPEPWRRLMPLPLAAGLYGVLLGLGFTTFVLTLANWALATISLAVGDPATGALIGLAFGAGRALPVVVIAPLADTDVGVRITEAMAERPAVLRSFRLADGLALGLCALALTAADAGAATVSPPPIFATHPSQAVTVSRSISARGTDPSVTGTALAWQKPGIGGFRRSGGLATRLPGQSPALGGPFAAWHDGDQVTIAAADTLAPIAQLAIPGVDKLAVSRDWLVYRVPRPSGGDQLFARPITDLSRERRLAAVRAPTQIGRPAIDGSVAVFHVAGRRQSRIVQVNLQTGRKRTLRRARLSQLLNPSVRNRHLLYVSVSRCHQRLLLGRRSGRGRDRALLSIAPATRRDHGHERGHTKQGRSPSYCGTAGRRRAAKSLWTTALSGRWAYVTRVRAGTGRAVILRLRR